MMLDAALNTFSLQSCAKLMHAILRVHPTYKNGYRQVYYQGGHGDTKGDR